MEKEIGLKVQKHKEVQKIYRGPIKAQRAQQSTLEVDITPCCYIILVHILVGFGILAHSWLVQLSLEVTLLKVFYKINLHFYIFLVPIVYCRPAKLLINRDQHLKLQILSQIQVL